MGIALAFVGILLTLVAIGFAYLIFRKEKQQLSKLENMTHELHMESNVKESVERFFGVGPSSDRQIKCFYPAEYRQRPLPSIYAGDYHAISVLVGLLGRDHIELHGIGSPADVHKVSLDGDCIYLCTPASNHALQSRYPLVDLRAKKNSPTGDPEQQMKNCQFPCWFAKDGRARKIVIANGSKLEELPSPADLAYVAAAKAPLGVRAPISGTQNDLGIVARIRVQEKGKEAVKLFVAGIHQYGTWIAADFFDRLCRRTGKFSYEDALRGGDDFVVVVWGDFNADELRVHYANVHHNYMWTRKKNSAWSRV